AEEGMERRSVEPGAPTGCHFRGRGGSGSGSRGGNGRGRFLHPVRMDGYCKGGQPTSSELLSELLSSFWCLRRALSFRLSPSAFARRSSRSSIRWRFFFSRLRYFATSVRRLSWTPITYGDCSSG